MIRFLKHSLNKFFFTSYFLFKELISQNYMKDFSQQPVHADTKTMNTTLMGEGVNSQDLII